MDAIEKSLSLHREAWNDYDKFVECLEKAEEVLKSEYLKGNTDPLIINNYAAALLDQHKDSEALELLIKNEVVLAEYCLNRAIAVAKANYDVSEIRHWNDAARSHPKNDKAILAFMDWQAL